MPRLVDPTESIRSLNSDQLRTVLFRAAAESYLDAAALRVYTGHEPADYGSNWDMYGSPTFRERLSPEQTEILLRGDGLAWMGRVAFLGYQGAIARPQWEAILAAVRASVDFIEDNFQPVQ